MARSYRVSGKGLQFSVREVVPGTWGMSSKSSGSRKRKRYPAKDLTDAIRKSGAMLAATGTIPETMTVATVLTRWVGRTSGSPDTKSDYLQSVEYFVRWLGKGTRWSALKLETLERYANSILERGLSHRAVDVYTRPIRSASRWAAANWPDTFRDFAFGFKLPRSKTSRRKQRALSFDQAGEFILFLRHHPEGWDILPNVVLGALCGLRVREVLRLTWDDIDLNRGTVAVYGAKTAESNRVLPLPALVHQVLSDHPQDTDQVSHYLDETAFRKILQERLSEWTPGFTMWAMELRNTIQTEGGGFWPQYWIDRWYGHVPKDVGTRHYDQKAEDTLFNGLVTEIRDRIDAAMMPYLEQWRAVQNKVLHLVKTV